MLQNVESFVSFSQSLVAENAVVPESVINACGFVLPMFISIGVERGGALVSPWILKFGMFGLQF